MGTNYKINFVPPSTGKIWKSSIQTELLKNSIEELLARINKQMSTYDVGSELSRFNNNDSTSWSAVSPELSSLVVEGLRISEITHGAYDITVGPLVNLWGFGPESHRDQIPSDIAIIRSHAQVGYWNLHVHINSVSSSIKKDHPGIYIDLSSLAKGYAVDQLAQLIETNGIQNYLVSIGGDLRAKGHNGRNQPWTVAIEQPIPEQHIAGRLIQIGDHSVSTAGSYRNYFEKNGQRYSHVINPHTGQPVLQTLASVTVISDTDMEADAIDTALMVLGPEDGFKLATEHHVAAFFILVSPDGKRFQEIYTPEFEAFLAIPHTH
jgi:thiamine biosynthesis lipoprotein